MKKDDLQMLLFDLGFEQTEENIEDDILLFEKDEIEVSLEIDNAIAIYVHNEKILEIENIDYDTIYKIIEGIQ